MDRVLENFLIDHKLVTEEQACELFHLEHKSVISRRSRGDMPTPAGKVGRRYFYHQSDIIQMIIEDPTDTVGDQVVVDVLGV